MLADLGVSEAVLPVEFTWVVSLLRARTREVADEVAHGVHFLSGGRMAGS